MKKNNKLFIRIDKDNKGIKYEFDKTDTIYDKSLYDIVIAECSSDVSFDEIITNKKAINKAIKTFNAEPFDKFGYAKDIYEDDLEGYEIDKKIHEAIRQGNKTTGSKFLNSRYEIYINGLYDDVINFINNNLNINNKKIILSREDGAPFKISDNKAMDILVNKINNLKNIYVEAEGNDNVVSIISYRDTINYIDDIVNNIKKLDLSPIEQIMYAYDIVRDRKYKLETKKQDKSESRDLTPVILGNRIVCAGFAEIFDKVSEKLGFNSHIQRLNPIKKDSHKGHERNVIYIKDDKYDIDGIYFFDATWDSKKNSTNNHFNSYRFFGMTLYDMLKIDYHSNNPLASEYSELINISNKIRPKLSELKNHDTTTFYKKMVEKLSELDTDDFLKLNHFSRRFFNTEVISPSKIFSYTYHNANNFDEENAKSIDKFLGMFNKKIPEDTFLKLVANVRIKEYYQFPDKFPLSTKKILDIAKKSGREIKISKENLILRCIFGENIKTSKEILKDEGIEKRISGVKLAKVLKLTLDKKQNEEDTE